jgi:hypothetical protein
MNDPKPHTIVANPTAIATLVSLNHRRRTVQMVKMPIAISGGAVITPIPTRLIVV